MRLSKNKKNYIYFLGIFILVFLGGFYGYRAYNYFFYKKRIFILKSINVTGKDISYSEKVSALRLSGIYKGENLLMIDLKRVSRLIASRRWVKDVTVYRSFPGSVTIALVKRKIFAMMVNGKDLYYISRGGFVMERANSKNGYDYPVIIGLSESSPDNYFRGIKKVLHFLMVSKTSVISNNISEIHLENNDGIVVYTKNGNMIKFGAHRYKDKLKILKKLFYEINKIHLKYKPYINLEYKGEAVVAVNTGSRVLPADYKNSVISANIFK